MVGAHAGGSPTPPARDRLRGLLGAVALVAATLVAYIPALRAGYIWDDDQYLYDNELVQRRDGLAGIWQLRYDADAGRLRINTPQYYPLVFTTFWLEYRLWGLTPAGYHCVNVLLHACSALLVWRLGRRLDLPAAWFVAGLFALHPVQVESVAWITERKNVLSGLFYFLGLLGGLNYLERGDRRWYAAGLCAFVAALLSKTVTCTLPAALLLIRWYQRARPGRREALLLGPMVVLGAAAGLLTAHVERGHVGAAHLAWDLTLPERALLIAPRALWFYAARIAWPHPLVFIYPRWQPDAEAWSAYLPLAGVALVAGVVLLTMRRVGRGPAAALAYSVVTLLPALGLFEVYPHLFSWVADHFQYLGGLGFMVVYSGVVVGLCRRLAHRQARLAAALPVVGRGVGLCLLVVLGALSWRQSRNYHSERHLWEHTLRANPQAWIASLNLATAAARAGRYDQAAEYFEYTAQFPAARAAAYGNWGIALLGLGRVEGALDKLRQAAALDPQDARVRASLGSAYLAAGRLAEAEEALLTAVRLDPDWVPAYLNLSLVYARQGRWAEAEECLRRAGRLFPWDDGVHVFSARLAARQRQWAEALARLRRVRPERLARLAALDELVEALWQTGREREALRVCTTGLRDRPNDFELLRQLAWLRAVASAADLRDGGEALRIATRLSRVRPNDPLVLDVLAAAQAEVGNYAAAATTAERALRAARAAGESEQAAQIAERLAGYRAGRPYRLPAPDAGAPGAMSP